ncbi:MAG: GIY-YIG nuclease family protein [Coleofasciculaceae cyanobacterium SM2_3_26]|nr:GIY-YIG nuclease family protein [Coleofasciculaceae cyanobacterium SM2_3_26]
MTAETSIPALAELTAVPYLNEAGDIPTEFQGSIGVYAICDRDRALQYVGYSRDISLSLKQHLVRVPHLCYWVKAWAIARPDRTVLEATKTAWIEEYGTMPPGNGADEALWTQPIDVGDRMTAEEREGLARQPDELGRSQFLKQVSRRVEQALKDAVEARGASITLRFNPKYKEKGLLDLK